MSPLHGATLPRSWLLMVIQISDGLGNRQIALLPMFVECLEVLLKEMYSVDSPGKTVSFELLFRDNLLSAGYLHHRSAEFFKQSPAIRGIFLDRV